MGANSTKSSIFQRSTADKQAGSAPPTGREVTHAGTMLVPVTATAPPERKPTNTRPVRAARSGGPLDTLSVATSRFGALFVKRQRWQRLHVADALSGEQSLTHWPTGSLIVKDRSDGDELELVAVMLRAAFERALEVRVFPRRRFVAGEDGDLGKMRRERAQPVQALARSPRKLGVRRTRCGAMLERPAEMRGVSREQNGPLARVHDE